MEFISLLILMSEQAAIILFRLKNAKVLHHHTLGMVNILTIIIKIVKIMIMIGMEMMTIL